jgi:phospholipid/cholesterol/gamma-HCH transport system substrate-binding protein
MKHENINYLMVGSFVMLVIAAFVVTMALLTGRGGETDIYTVYYENIAGLKYGTIVSYEGYQIGQVENIEPIQKPGETRYKVSFSIQRGWKIPANSEARIVSSGLLSEVAINIAEGDSAEYLQPGDTVTGREGANIFASVGNAATELQALIIEVRTLVQSLAGESGIDTIFTNITDLTGKLNRSADTLQNMLGEGTQRNFDEFLANMNHASGNMNRVSNNVAGLVADISTTLDKIDEVATQSSKLLSDNKGDIEKSIASLRASLEVVNEHINAVAFNLDATSRNMSEFSRQIRENPGLLLGSTPPKDKLQETKK